MPDSIAPAAAPVAGPRRRWGGLWTPGALLVAALVLGPVVSVLWLAAHPQENIWPHLLSTTLPRYLANTLVLVAGVGLLTAAVGTGAAWLVTFYRFPGRRWLQWALLMPLAVPAYLGAYALVDFLEYAGPVQRGLRALFGWQSPRDYWFPEIRTRGAAILVLSVALYPYVYILARAAFREQSGATFEVARALGAGAWGRLMRVGLPLARPAVAAGVAVVGMEVVNDFGTVDFFAVQTLTTGIFSVWLQAGNLGGAAQIATLSLGLIVMLVVLEKLSRARARTFGAARAFRPVEPERLAGWRGWGAAALCLAPMLAGFALPVGVLLSHALGTEAWAAAGLGEALWHSLATGGLAAVITVSAGLFIVYAARLSGRRLPVLLLPVTAIGYAAPGAVLALGILFPLAGFDNWLADRWLALTGRDPGLLLTGSAAALVFAYSVRFFAIAQGAADAAIARVPPSLPMAARALGRTKGQVLRSVHLPLISASMGSALLLVFVDCVKELPATLLLRPFSYETLATRAHAKASLEDIGGAAAPGLILTAVGLVAVALLARAQRE
ncbi:ABC transporter permease [Pseudoroseicyclus tamaricis]|uniref:Iron ABC transporter permease n=1 Tax=Pseudoroseicyclus tamaricis TaxID=2705421 RepID=A0A6B2JRV2_9RHOB|nr:iron ABC transporter permease [Pseudoroseicyclus tamaricis]NDV00715.1 iron ABC transporter permease [Pseudoroseicyclus tamaricis]